MKPTAYILDASTLAGIVTLIVAFLGLCIGYFAITSPERSAARAACASAALLSFVFIMFLINCYPPRPYTEVPPEKCDEGTGTPQKIIIYEDISDYAKGVSPKMQAAPTLAGPLGSVQPESSATQQANVAWCETQAAKNILKMIDRCGTYTVCPTELANLGDITIDEQREIMRTLPKASVFFPKANATDPINTLDGLSQLVKGKSADSVVILIGRSSKAGKSRPNKDLSRRRVLHVKRYIDNEIAPTETMLAYYGEDVLQLSRKDADAFSVGGDLNVDQLNQSVFAFRFDCPRRK